jgi:hypothetical protein
MTKGEGYGKTTSSDRQCQCPYMTKRKSYLEKVVTIWIIVPFTNRRLCSIDL